MAEENLEQNVNQGAGQPVDQSQQIDQQIPNQQGSEFSQLNPDDFPEEERDKYKEWQTKYTQTRQQETSYIRDLESQKQNLEQQIALLQEKAQNYDSLIQNPGFQQWARNQYDNSQSNSNGFDDSVFEEFEGGDALKSLANAITQRIEDRIKPLEQAFLSNRNDVEFQSLVNLAKEKGWPDPTQYRDAISMNMQRYGMPVQDAYQKVLGQMQIVNSGFATRQPINSQFQQPQQAGQTTVQNTPPQNQNSGIPTVGNRSNVVNPPSNTRTTQNILSSRSTLDEALEERSSGKTPAGVPIDKIIESVVQDMNKNGANIDFRDL